MPFLSVKFVSKKLVPFKVRHDLFGSRDVFTEIINNSVYLFEDFYSTMQADNQAEFGKAPDTGFALQVFMNDDNPSDLLNLSSAVVNKNVNLKVNTTASGYLSTLKMVMF